MIGRLDHQRCLHRRGIGAVDGVLQGGGDEDVTLEAEQFIVGDEVATTDMLE
jgi:hypothetical protein